MIIDLVRRLKKWRNNDFHYAGADEAHPRVAVYPFVSGDAFIWACDLYALKTNEQVLPVRSVRSPRVLFVEGERIAQTEQLLAAYPSIDTLVCHNWDGIVPAKDIAMLEARNVRLFCTNLKHETAHAYCIPIGLENAWRWTNGSVRHYNLPIQGNKPNTCKTLLSFNPSTNPEARERTQQVFEEAGYPFFCGTVASYTEQLRESHFVISPPGNGIDCHRTWEAMYHRAIPVLEKDSQLYPNHRLPILSVERYEDFIALSEKEKLGLYEQIWDADFEALYMDYWTRLIRTPRNAESD